MENKLHISVLSISESLISSLIISISDLAGLINLYLSLQDKLACDLSV